MISNESSRKSESTKSNWIYPLLILLIVEKIIQHIAVTLAFYFNWRDIVSTVLVSPAILIILGAMIAALFVLSLWGMVGQHRWTLNLLIALAMFDIVGEFLAQGRISIMITVSFIVAILLLILAFIYRRYSAN